MKKSIVMFIVAFTIPSVFATGAGSLGACQSQAQQAVLRIAKINGISYKTEGDYNKLVIDRVGPPDQGEQVIEWRSVDQRFNVTTVNRAGCLVTSVTFNPEP